MLVNTVSDLILDLPESRSESGRTRCDSAQRAMDKMLLTSKDTVNPAPLTGGLGDGRPGSPILFETEEESFSLKNC